jgi:2-phospho-L-lactate guanylyltransferase
MTVAIVPVKRFVNAKTRLSDGLSSGVRRALAEAMVTDVLIALRRARRVREVIVVSGEQTVAALASGYDAAAVIDDPADAGHSGAATLGVHAAMRRGARRVLLLPGDCPTLDPAELDAMLDRTLDGPEVVVLPDRHGEGTNGLLLTPPDVIAPAFGPGSRERHERLAHEAGARCEVLELPSVALDVDTPDDLEALRAALDRTRGGAAHTRGLLARVERT